MIWQKQASSYSFSVKIKNIVRGETTTLGRYAEVNNYHKDIYFIKKMKPYVEFILQMAELI
jgi:hypothetical protein